MVCRHALYTHVTGHSKEDENKFSCIKTSQPDNLALFHGQLGIKFENHRHGTGPLHYAADIDNVVFEIYPLPKDKEKADDTLRLGFTVDNVDEVLRD